MKTIILTSALAVAGTAAFAAPIPLSGSMHYTQDFDVLDTKNNTTTSTTAWADDSTIPGWFLYKASSGLVGGAYTYRVSNGLPGQGNTLADTGHFYSIGALDNTDRALGAVPITAQGEHSLIAVFQNTSGAAVKLANINYSAELRRTNQNANVVETIAVWWRKDTDLTNLLTMTTATATVADWPADKSTTPSGPFITGWNRVLEADFTTTSGATPNTQVTANTNTPVVATVVNEISVAPGEYLAVRWGNINDAGADAMMGIDDLDLNFVSSVGSINGSAANIVRADAGTARVPEDDTVTFDLNVTDGGGGGAAGWTITAPAGLAGTAGQYGVPVSIPAQAVASFTGPAHVMSLTVADVTNPLVATQVQVVAPWGRITASPASNFVYLDKGTAVTTDDEVSFALNVDSTYASTGYTANFVTGTVTGNSGNGTYGTPLTVTRAAPGSFLAYTFVDSADPAVTGTLAILPPGIIGTDATTLSPRPLLSKPLAQSGGVYWTINGAARTFQQVSVPVQADYSLESEVVDLSTAGDVTFKATLVASTVGGTSGFEAQDSFAMDLIIDGGAPVSVLGPLDTDADNKLTGTVELPATAGLTSTFNFTYPIPAAANSVQVRVTGNSNSAQESFTISNLEFAIPQPSITLSVPANITRNANGPGFADDTVTFDVTVTGANGGTGWTANNVTPANGAFGPVTFTVPAGNTAVTTRISDNTYPNAFADLTVALPGPYTIGSVNTGAGSGPLFSEETAPPSAEWVLSGPPPVFTMRGQAAYALPVKTVTSEVLSVTGAGALRATAHLHIHDTSSGFEATDEFNAWIVLDGNTAAPISMITAADTDASGTLTGAELCPAPAVNPTTQDFDYDLAADIPAGTNTVQIFITGLCNSTNETMIVSAITIGAGATDTDGDGMTDAYEDANGLNKASAADRDLDLDGDGQSNYLESLAGTEANNSGSLLHITGGTLNPVTGDGSTTWTSVAGKRYRVQVSADLTNWTDSGSVITASGAATTAAYTIAGAPLTGKSFLRVKVVP